jgi:hypothetical protein|tara:strand:+ start:34 stop:237 length:204 start_codon:yes stop_codon:yes gene_type:complete
MKGIDSIAELSHFVEVMEKEFGGVPKEINIISENIINQIAEYMGRHKGSELVSAEYLGVRIKRPDKK